MSGVKCPLAHCGGFLEFTSVAGKVVESCPRCTRRRAGICRDCPSRVEGSIKAIRCKACKAARRREQERDRMRDPELHARRTGLARKRYKQRSPQRVAERAQYSREWRKAHPDRVKKWKRAYLLKQKPAYLRTQRKWNRDPQRAAKKRAAAIAKYYELHPVRPDPHCSGCGVEIHWTPGHGRPRLTCDSCCTPAELRRRQGGYNATAYRKRRAAA